MTDNDDIQYTDNDNIPYVDYADAGADTKKQNIEAKIAILQTIRSDIQNYKTKAKKFYDLADKASDIYIQEEDSEHVFNESEFAIFWSNVQTLRPALFGQLPKINISKRHSNFNELSNLALKIAEQVADYIADNSNLKQVIMSSVNNRLICGRGTIWFSYFADIDNQNVNSEKMIVEYVQNKDFGHNVVGDWSDVTKVWRKIYLTKSEAEKFFENNKTIIEKLKFSDDFKISDVVIASDDDSSDNKDCDNVQKNKKNCALLYEVWCKDTKKVYFLDKDLKDILRQKDIPYNLSHFFPCPKPLYATLKENSLFPKPDYFFYEKQAETLQELALKRRTIIKMIKSVGLYDATHTKIVDLLTSEHGTMLPVGGDDKIFIEGNINSLYAMLDIKPYVDQLMIINDAITVIKNEIYEITGIADILRGQGQSYVTATTDGIKAKFATLRLSEMQDDVQNFIHDAYVIMVEMALSALSVEALDNIIEIDEVNNLKNNDPDKLKALISLVKDISKLNFKIDIETDSTIKINQDSEKADRMEFANTFSPLLAQAIQAPKELIPIIASVLKFVVASFRGGRELEADINKFIDAIMQNSEAQEPEKPDPEIEKEKQKQDFELHKQQTQFEHNNAIKQMEFQHDTAIKQMEYEFKLEIEKIRAEVRLNDTGRSTYGQPL